MRYIYCRIQQENHFNIIEVLTIGLRVFMELSIQDYATAHISYLFSRDDVKNGSWAYYLFVASWGDIRWLPRMSGLLVDS